VVGLESDVVVAEPLLARVLLAMGGLLSLLETRGVSGGLSEVGEGVSTETRLASGHGDPSADGSSSLDGAPLLRL
jgi:hypothetical protein